MIVRSLTYIDSHDEHYLVRIQIYWTIIIKVPAKDHCAPSFICFVRMYAEWSFSWQGFTLSPWVRLWMGYHS